jgi:hypothetical protein
MQIHQWELSCSMQTDGRTSRHEGANICFSQFCESALKKVPALLKVSRLSEFCRQKLVPESGFFFGKVLMSLRKIRRPRLRLPMGEHHASGVKKFRSQ